MKHALQIMLLISGIILLGAGCRQTTPSSASRSAAPIATAENRTASDEAVESGFYTIEREGDEWVLYRIEEEQKTATGFRVPVVREAQGYYTNFLAASVALDGSKIVYAYPLVTDSSNPNVLAIDSVWVSNIDGQSKRMLWSEARGIGAGSVVNLFWSDDNREVLFGVRGYEFDKLLKVNLTSGEVSTVATGKNLGIPI